MNQRQTELYRNLMTLVANNEAFYFADFEVDGHILRIFNYRLASYTDFLAPDALECRGHMFEVDSNGESIRLLSWTPEKFFNYRENDFTMTLDLTQVDEVYDKLDGSLISTYMIDGELKLKSKGSVTSDQAVDSMNWLDHIDQAMLYHNMASLTEKGFTVVSEWTSPLNRIVIGYMEPSLRVLCVRSHEDGSYMPYDEIVSIFGRQNVVQRVAVDDPVAFVASVPDMKEQIEGFVVRMKSGQRFKLKTDLYLSLHHAKDSVNNPRRLFECILDEGVDDLRGMFYTDQVAIMMIDQMQVKVDHLFNAMVKEVETFYTENKSLNRKDFALKGQAEVTPMYFGLVMNRYLEKDPQYKSFMKRKYQYFGFKDEKIVEE